MTDFSTASARSQSNNWLKNGNFARVPRTVVAKAYPESDPSVTIADAVTPDVSCLVNATPENYFLANWSILGSANGIGSIDLNPMDKRTGLRLRSFDSGNLVRISFSGEGTITLSQTIEVVNQFRGLPASLAFSAYKIAGEVKVQAKVQFGTASKDGMPFFSSGIGGYRRIVQPILACPLDLSKVEIQIVVSGKGGESIGVGGFCFALGSFDIALPFSESAGDVLLPRGAIILWEGDSCPAGFRSVEGADEAFLYQTYGDPNVLSGGAEKYVAPDPDDPLYDFLSTRQPEVRTTLGDNEHFSHQETNLFSRKVDEFQSATPDIQKLLASADFNDQGEPPGPGSGSPPSWSGHKPSVRAIDDSHGVNWPFSYEAQTEIEKFKMSSQMNEVLPGDREETKPVGTGGRWPGGHRHMLRSQGTPTLPPYQTYRFCEKI